MPAIFLVLVAGAGAVWVARWLAGLPGTVSVSLLGLTVETSTALALVAVVLLVLALLGLLRALGWLLSVPARLRRRRVARRRAAGDAAVTAALVALAAGEAGDARREAGRARRLLGDTGQTLLLAAEAERLSGDDATAAALFQMLAKRDDAALLGLRGLFRQAVAREDWPAAAQLAGQAERVHPGGAWLREERAQLAVRTGDWRQALRLSAPDAPRAAYAVAAIAGVADGTEATRMAKQTWKDHPDFTPAALAYAARLRADGREARAQDVLRDAWARNPQPDLATLALAPLTEPMARVKAAGRLVMDAPAHPESRFLMAQLNLRAGLTGEARRHLDRARDGIGEQRRFWLLLADLEGEDRGDTETGRLAQRDALRRAATAAADPAWHCDACGGVTAQWTPTCPTCQTAGRVRWGLPTPRSLPPQPPMRALPA